VAGIRVPTVVAAKDAGARSAGMAWGQPSDSTMHPDGSLCVRVLEIEDIVNEVLGGVLAK
jgi:hypothetical protein